ncbi:MAG TPA: cupin domain-containing protein [Allosphingosinicella sp.]|nr:cupin domain-containing protein [Allosphingosinicella sp.]
MAPLPKELDLVCADFGAALDLLRNLGLRLEIIYPADEPHSAVLSHDGTIIRLTSRPDAPPASVTLPEFRPEFVVTHASGDSGEGRAGMRYRDLIPGRLGGRYIASHITIPEGGPVADWVHFHRIAVQLICVRRGWVRVVYEDQGPPFVMQAGDLVLQPPGIRHRVLESSPGLEVVEITCPALHETLAEHEMDLPNGGPVASRLYGGQHFLHHVAATSSWTAWHGAEAQETQVSDASGRLAEARILKPGASGMIAVPPHDGELVFGFVLEGRVQLDHGHSYELGPADSFVIPPGEAWRLRETSDDFRLLHVTTGRIRR